MTTANQFIVFGIETEADRARMDQAAAAIMENVGGDETIWYFSDGSRVVLNGPVAYAE